jgi:hypothetical protein
MDYSHALSIKVLSKKTNKRDKHIEKIVKEHFLNANISYNNIPIVWKHVEWGFPKNQFDSGDILTLSPFSIDMCVLNAVTTAIQDIENLMKSTCVITDEIIIFEITKPLVNSVALKECAGTIYGSSK